MWAAEQQHPEAVKALLAAGADPSREVGRRRPAAQLHGATASTLRAVEDAQERRKRAAAAGRTYEEQLEIEQNERS